jgi:four helix bundle protein
MTNDFRSFESWAASVPAHLTGDPIWRMATFRLASYCLAVGYNDVLALSRCRPTQLIAPQLYKALGSIPANIAEGYSRSSGRDRCRVYEYGLGSARESTVWYSAATPILGKELVEERQAMLQDVVRRMLVVIPAERNRSIGGR